MSAEIIDTANGILTIKMTGKLTQPEMAAAQQRAAQILKQQSKMGILVLVEDFKGWAKGGDWGDLSFQIENDKYIQKIAIVGDKRWEGLSLLFAAQGLRKFPVAYFPPEQAAQAQSWLKEHS